MTSPLNKVLCRPRQPIRTMNEMNSPSLLQQQHHHQQAHFGDFKQQQQQQQQTQAGTPNAMASLASTATQQYHGSWSLQRSKLEFVNSSSSAVDGPTSSGRRSKSPDDSSDTDPGYGTSYGSILSSSTAGRSSSSTGGGATEAAAKTAASEETAELTDMFVSN